MNPNIINTGVVSILCATSLVLGIVMPASTVTPPSKTTPVPKATPTPKTIPTIKASPALKVTPVPAPIPNPASQPLVAVPVLTPTILKNFTDTYGRLLEVKFTADRQQKIQQRLSRDWVINLGLRNTVMQTIALEPQIANGTPAERNQLQAKLIGNLRQQAVDGDPDALWLVSFFDAAPKNWLAPGQPPLTRMTTDITTDALCFMVNEVMGKSVATPDLKLKNAIAAKLTAEYPNISPNTKQEFSRLPAAWLRFKDNEWFQRGDDFREQMRVHWGKNLEAYIPELREMNKLRRSRMEKIKSDPTIAWGNLNPIQRQAAIQKTEVDFQNSVRALPQIKTVSIANYINTMQVASSVGNSPTRFSQKAKILKVK
jgi:hypothetical protein